LALTPGTRLGVYEIVAQIGEGGMGLVYLARDTKLNRDVALKVLPDVFATDGDRLARFTREAQTLASLNHPNIAHIHGLEESGGVRALVMELVEGEDLSQRIARGPIPVHDALPIARQIAEALEAAHQQGIIHRDLKPANIKLRADGAVKVLDFGLAKAIAPEHDQSSATHRPHLPTITSPALLTSAGLVLGTAAYMAPEQAKGREADKRSDIWAFGCVLYEMLTGRRPFDGDDMTDVLGAVVRLEPSWEGLPADVPPAVRTLLRQCLVKDPRRRVGDIAAALFVLDHQASVAGTASAAPFRSTRLPWIVAGLLAVALIATAAVAMRMSRPSGPAPDQIRFTIAPPPNTSFGGPPAGGTGNIAQLAVSPDGKYVVFVAGAPLAFQLWLRPLASAEPRPIPGTEGSTFPFWSPDSRFVAFFAGAKLKKVAVSGGPPMVLADASAGRGGSWSGDVIVFDRALGSGLFRVSSNGGEPAAVTTLGDGEDAHRWPHFLPDGNHFLYNAVTGACCPPAKRGVIKVGSLDRGEPTLSLFEGDSAALYTSRNLLFARDQTLMAQAFDPVLRKVTGDVVPVLEGVSTEGSRYVSASVSGNGTLLYASGGPPNPQQLTWFDRTGKAIGSLGEGAGDVSPSLSPDERHVAFALRTGNPQNLDIWTIDLARNVRNRVTTDAQPEGWPVWSSDGTRIVFGIGTRGIEGPPSLARLLVRTLGDKNSVSETLVEAASTPQRPCGPRQCALLPTDWSADGRYILYTFVGTFPATNDIWALPLAGDRTPFPVVNSEFNEVQGVFSPDSRWIAYAADNAGQPDVYVQPFRRDGDKIRISPSGGRNPHWRADGRELFYLDATGAMMAVSIDGAETGLPKRLFPAGVVSPNQVYVVTRDGQRFLVNTRLQNSTTPTPLTVIVNWTSTLPK
jgi:Tol biopolymer transport system component